MKLKALLQRVPQGYWAISRQLDINPGQLWRIANEEKWPRQANREELQQRIEAFLTGCGIPASDLRGLWAAAATEAHNESAARKAAFPFQKERPAEGLSAEQPAELTEEWMMLLRKQQLFPATRKHFGLFRDPFSDDVQTAEDVFVTPDIRYIREAMWQTAKHGGFLAVVGESGAGKSTLRRDLIDRIRRESASIITIEPYVLGMEDNDNSGKTLKAGHIAEAILSAVAPLDRPKSSPEARFSQLHQRLKDSLRAGYSHTLIIEEAHGLAVPTIKHLKRFFELEDGFRKLLSIILIGQPELKLKLSERNPGVREVVQRCEVAELAPLDERIGDYLAFKFDRVGSKVDKLLEPAAVDAIQTKLLFTAKDGKQRISLLYPLAVANLLTACLNLATEIGEPRVTADIVREV